MSVSDKEELNLFIGSSFFYGKTRSRVIDIPAVGDKIVFILLLIIMFVIDNKVIIEIKFQTA